MLDRIPSFLKNKYSIALIAFFVWIMFFDKNNFINQFKLTSTLKSLNNQKAFYFDEIRKDSTSLRILKTDASSLEKFAREKYLMKKDNEDIFLIVEEKN